MFCKHCGKAIDRDTIYCPYCGKLLDTPDSSDPSSLSNVSEPTVRKYSGKAIAGFVVSLVGILAAAIPCGIVGLVLSLKGLKETDFLNFREFRKGRGLAVWGIVISIIDLVVGALNLLSVFSAF